MQQYVPLSERPTMSPMIPGGSPIPQDVWQVGGRHNEWGFQQIIHPWALIRRGMHQDFIYVHNSGSQFLRVFAPGKPWERTDWALAIESSVLAEPEIIVGNMDVAYPTTGILSKGLVSRYLGDTFTHRRMYLGWYGAGIDIAAIVRFALTLYANGVQMGDLFLENFLLWPATGRVAAIDLEHDQTIMLGENGFLSREQFLYDLYQRLQYSWSQLLSRFHNQNITAVTNFLNRRMNLDITFMPPSVLDWNTIESPWWGVNSVGARGVVEFNGTMARLQDNTVLNGTPAGYTVVSGYDPLL